MVKDISADVAYIAGVWTEGVLYGIHVIVYLTLCYIFTSRAYTRGRELSSRILLIVSTIMFALSTAHVGLALRELFDGFVFQLKTTPGGPPVFFRENVFPKRKAIYIFNTLLGDALLVWRVYVIYGCNWIVAAPSALILVGTTITGLKTVAQNVMSEHSSVFDPSILHWVTATFVLTIATQIISTVLIAGRIYAAARPFSLPPMRSVNSDQTPAPSHKSSGRGSGKTLNNREDGVAMDGQRAKYLSLVFIVAESGAVYTSAALIQLITYLLNMNAGVILEMMLAQLSALVPMVIIVRVGLGLAYNGPSGGRNQVHARVPGRGQRQEKDWSESDNGIQVRQLSTFYAAGGDTTRTQNSDGDVDVERSLGSKTQISTASR
ncbi:hypothetical protein D9619_002334 [Psilocybe cf. subviscida]|uniref:Uncharacterized protein n=1 Tax=Psilocybe cf. subviscida TaxID=2480587 RepID=A0A8H5ETV9_9AGAR|nr:hypothetical protein D9619_002334 [Psilocybe cf. subviscida]